MKRSSPDKPHRENGKRVLGACGHLIPGWPSLFTKHSWTNFAAEVYLCDECEEWVPATALHTIPGQVELPFPED